MLIGIQEPLNVKIDPVTNVYRQLLDYNGIRYKQVDISDIHFWEDIKKIDAFIFRWAHHEHHQQIAHAIIPVIEKEYKKICFPNYSTCWHYDDKIRQYYLLKAQGFPVVESFVFYRIDKALDWIKTAELPLVFKLKTGSGSVNVKLIRTRTEAESHIRKMFRKGLDPSYYGFWNVLKTFNYEIKPVYRYWGIRFRDKYLRKDVNSWSRQRNYVYFQKFLPGNSYDTRVQITGDRAFAFVRYNRPNDFRASGSNNWSLEHEKIDMEFVRIAFEISKTFGFQSMAYDFVYDENKKPAIVEISYCFGDYPEFCNGYWDTNLKWHKGRFIPEYFDLIDFLNMPDMILPNHIEAVSKYKDVKI